MSSYSFIHIEKIKTYGHMVNVNNHNLRVKMKDNIIPELAELNREYMSLAESMIINKNTAKRYIEDKKSCVYIKDNTITITSTDRDLLERLQVALKEKGLSQDKISDITKGIEKYKITVKSKDIDLINEVLNECCQDQLRHHLAEGKLTCEDVFKSRIANLDYYENHNIRSNAVLAYETVLSYTANPDIDPYEWVETSIKWLHDTFDKSPDGKSNILSATLHMDEPGNPHIHAVIIPIDERGHLNASRFTDGFSAMTHMQTSYAEAVKGFGLERGIAGSTAEHKKISKLYAKLNSAQNVPKPMQGESAMEYHKRIHSRIETMMSASLGEIETMRVRERQKLDSERQEVREAIAEDIEEHDVVIKRKGKKIKEMDKTIEEKKEVISSYESHIDILERQLELMNIVYDEEEFEDYQRLKKGIALLEEADPDTADTLKEYMDIAYEMADTHQERTDENQL